ncbi:hypothetical protein GCM10020254_34070 [Streptomyces goshikiensis]
MRSGSVIGPRDPLQLLPSRRTVRESTPATDLERPPMQNLILLKEIVEQRIRMRTSRGGDEGQTVFEYLGIIVIIVLIIGAIVGTGLADNIANAISTALENITSQG